MTSSIRLRPYVRLIPVLGSIALSMLVCAWFLTYGKWHLFEVERFGIFYDDQARSLLQGRWDVTADSISGEAFLIKGKSYGYFGFFPALPRMLLNSAMPFMYDRWSRVSMLCAVMLIAIGAVVCLQTVSVVRPGPFAAALFSIVATLGSSVVFLCSRAFIYHEATLWSSVLALYSYLCFASYLRRPSAPWLGWGCLLGASSFFTRATIGTGTLACAILLAAGLALRSVSNMSTRLDRRVGPLLQFFDFPRTSAPARHCLVLTAALAIIFLSHIYVNHAKFGTLLDGAPLQYNVQYTPERLAKFGGKHLTLNNLPFGFYTYLIGDRAPFRDSFPWLTLVTPLEPEAKNVKLDNAEPSAPIPWAIPALFGLSIMGVIDLLRDPGGRRGLLLILMGGLVGGFTVFAFTSFSYRYEHDLYPFFVFAGAAGLSAISRLPNIGLHRLAYRALALATLWSISANCAFAIEFQRELCWGVDDKIRASFAEFREQIDARVRHVKLAILPGSF